MAEQQTGELKVKGQIYPSRSETVRTQEIGVWDWLRGGLTLQTDGISFWYERGILRTRRTDFFVRYLDMEKIEETPGGKVLFRFRTPRECTDRFPDDKISALVFSKLWGTGKIARGGRARLDRWHRKVVDLVELLRWFQGKMEELEDEVFTRCKVTGRFSVREGVALCSKLFPGSHRNAGQAVKDIVTKLVKSGRLDGFFDEERGQYTAAALAHRTVTQISLDFNSLVSTLGDRGLVLERLTCPACSGQIALPEEGNQVKCQYCGTDIYAMDLFEKFRGILDL